MSGAISKLSDMQHIPQLMRLSIQSLTWLDTDSKAPLLLEKVVIPQVKWKSTLYLGRRGGGRVGKGLCARVIINFIGVVCTNKERKRAEVYWDAVGCNCSVCSSGFCMMLNTYSVVTHH